MQDQSGPREPGNSKIRHNPSSIGGMNDGAQQRQQPQTAKVDPDDLSAIKISDTPGDGAPKEIRALGMKSRHEDEWSRTPNTTGQGAIHIKTFHCKVTEDGLAYMDQQINEWLDAHPQYEVKQVETCIGTFTGKIKEPHVICQVWV